MEVICSPRRRLELDIHGTKSQEASIKAMKFVFIYFQDHLTLTSAMINT
jgi:hypothetical protein